MSGLDGSQKHAATDYHGSKLFWRASKKQRIMVLLCYCWLRILSLSELGNWAELEKLSKVKKSPAGHEPFVEVCLKHNNIHEAQKYLPKVRDELKVKYYVKAKLFEEASRIAFEQKDVQGLLYIQNHCQTSDRTLSDKINLLVSQLANKK